MARYASVGSGAWQACGASLALRHGGPELEHLSYNELQELFRRASRACQEHEKSASNVHRLSASQTAHLEPTVQPLARLGRRG